MWSTIRIDQEKSSLKHVHTVNAISTTMAQNICVKSSVFEKCIFTFGPTLRFLDWGSTIVEEGVSIHLLPVPGGDFWA